MTFKHSLATRSRGHPPGTPHEPRGAAPHSKQNKI